MTKWEGRGRRKKRGCWRKCGRVCVWKDPGKKIDEENAMSVSGRE